jgi:hypothetical protein
MKKLSIALCLATLCACSTTRTQFVPAPRPPLSAELAREPATCAPLSGGAKLLDLSNWAACWKAASNLNSEHVKALQGLWAQ